MKKAWMLFIFVFLTAGSLHAFDDLIDVNFEKRVNQIYKASYSKIVSDSEWNFFLDKVQSESYTIRQGDTLWELSSIFFGDGFYWSKIWSLNERITNPHLIYPNAIVQFFGGTVAQAPGIQVLPGIEPPPPGAMPVEFEGGAGAPADAPLPGPEPTIKRDIPGPELFPGAPKIPPPQLKIKPVPDNIPPAFQGASFSIENYDRTGMSFDVRPPPPVQPNLVPSAFFFEGPPADFTRTGRVVEMEGGEEFAGWGSIVYIKTTREYAVGDIITVIGPEYDFQFSRFEGTVMRYMGEVKVLEAITSDGYRARVISSIMPIAAGAYLSDEVIPSLDADAGPDVQKEYYVIGGIYDEERGLFGQGDIVFISGGSNQGVKYGDTYALYKNRTVRYDNSNYWKSPRPIAQAKVFRAEPNVSSAIILWLDEDIRVFDTTGKIKAGPMNIGEGERNALQELEGKLDKSEEYQEAGTAPAAKTKASDEFDSLDEAQQEGAEGGDEFDEGFDEDPAEDLSDEGLEPSDGDDLGEGEDFSETDDLGEADDAESGDDLGDSDDLGDEGDLGDDDDLGGDDDDLGDDDDDLGDDDLDDSGGDDDLGDDDDLGGDDAEGLLEEDLEDLEL